MDSDHLYRNFHSSIVDTGLVGFVNSRLHRSLERDAFGVLKYQKRILELGAGKGQHLKYVNPNFDTYLQSDIRIENILESTDSRVVNQQIDAEDLHAFEDHSFDRIIATCLIIHLNDPEHALSEWKRVTCPGGTVSIYVPCEPGLLLRIMRYLTTNLKARKLGYRHLSIHYREHISFFVRLNLLIKEVFDECEIQRRFFPFFWLPSWNMNLWCTYQIKIPM